MIHIGYGRHAQVQQAARQCRETVPGEPAMLMAFVGGKHQPDEALLALREQFGDQVSIVGGSAAGTITRDEPSYTGLELAVAGFYDADILPSIHVARDMLEGEHKSGEALGRQIREVAAKDALVILFYDSVAEQVPLRLHNGSTLVNGVQAGLQGHPVHLVGGGTLTNFNLADAWVLDGQAVTKHAALALVFPPTVSAETRTLHGCRPVSTFMRITRIEGAEVFELDGERALDVIGRKLGLPLDGLGEELSLLATLGEKHGDRYAPYDENAYVNRLILRSNPATGSITLFEEDFQLGAHVQIMGRDNALMLESVQRGVAEVNEHQRHLEPFFALYIDCAGRASVFSGAHVEEAQLVMDTLDPRIPLLGFYSGVELAPFEDYSRPLDWTGVLTILGRA